MLLDNAERLDKLVDGDAPTEPDRAGVDLDTWRGMMAKNDQIRQNLVPLSKQYMTPEAAQADILNIPDGSTTFVRSSDDAYLAVEYKNTGGTLEATGRRMISAGYVDALRDLVTTELAKIMAFGAAQTTDAYPDIAGLILDSVETPFIAVTPMARASFRH